MRSDRDCCLRLIGRAGGPRCWRLGLGEIPETMKNWPIRGLPTQDISRDCGIRKPELRGGCHQDPF